ncbi:MAG: hypothetical protein AAF530_01300 [Pseudomonadota bacterium]
MKAWLCGGFLAVLMTTSAGAASDLDGDQIKDLISGNTLSVVTRSLAQAEGFFEADGQIRGQRDGEAFEGTWSIKDNRLCFDLPGNDFDICRTVAREGDEVLMFNESGGPAGRLQIEKGNPNNW